MCGVLLGGKTFFGRGHSALRAPCLIQRAAAACAAGKTLDVGDDIAEIDVPDDIKAERASDSSHDYNRQDRNDQPDNGVTDGADRLLDFAFFTAGKYERNTTDENENDGEEPCDNYGVSKALIDNFNNVVFLGGSDD